MPVIAAPKLPEMALDAKLPEMPLEAPPKLPEVPMEIPAKLADEVGEESGAKSPQEKRKNLTDQQRVAIVHYLLANSAGGRLKHGDMKAAATHFGVHRATIRRLWKLHTASGTSGGLGGQRRQSDQGALGAQTQGTRRGAQDPHRGHPGGAAHDGERTLDGAGREQQCGGATY
ncbi:hypothetical protein ON010_g17717 [Phytophthora cinnamomi]|nr:hypothetical protein ON010_g17717 [Phytophthora cinnamomi]